MQDSRTNRLISIIDCEISKITWTKNNFTSNIKISALESFKSLLVKFPEDTTNYILNSKRSLNFQRRLFEEFISILEQKIPFSVLKNKKEINVNSLEDLNIFCGKTTFNSTVLNNKIINKTKEIYIGGRKSSYIKRYFIGKIISITDINNVSLIKNIKFCSFDYILTQNLVDNTEVVITHLMMTPHYQMGSLCYINRARKSIVDNYCKHILCQI